MKWEPDCKEAVDLAKRSVPDDAKMGCALLAAALYHRTAVREDHPELASCLEPPVEVRNETPVQVDASDELGRVLGRLEEPVSAQALFSELLRTAELRALVDGGTGQGWRTSAERRQAIEALSAFGRFLTEKPRPRTGLAHREGDLRNLIRILAMRKRNNALVVGPSGTGKTALVFELARRIANGHASIPEWLRDRDIFELSPSLLRAGASMVGEYEKRVNALLDLLREHPKIILFVDEVHTLLQSGMHMRSPFSQAEESLKAPLSRGEITCIGCTTTAEFRHYIEGDQALVRRFSLVKVEPPTPETTVKILRHRLPRVAKHYSPLRIPKKLMERTVELSEEHLPTLHQPDKAIRLLDEGCAFCAVAVPPLPELTEESLLQALGEMTGRKLVADRPPTEGEVYEHLRERIVGQDRALRGIAAAFAGGLGSRTWTKSDEPRGVFLFGGPTGVGKTQTARLLAEVLGDGREEIVRVDCNTLQGSGYDSKAVDYRLLGSPPGLVGHSRQGGVLSRIRDHPNSIVLFDELEKADPGLGKLLLRVLDEGRIEDNSGALLDFRRAFIVFTTNAGCSYEARESVGFAAPAEEDTGPRAEIDAIRAQLGAVLGMEFLGRITHTFLFEGLRAESIAEIMGRQLELLRKQADARGLELAWDPEVVEHVVSSWEPRLGARYLTMILRNRIREQLGVAEAQGELEGVRSIRLAVLEPEQAAPGLAGVVRKKEGDALVIGLA